jgi:DNA-binding NarL/FixJ family response regulator
VRVLVIDNSEIFRMGLRAALVGARDMEIVAEAGDHVAAALAAELHQPDLVLVDVHVYEREAFALASLLRGIVPLARILVLSARASDALVRQVMLAGAGGCTSKSGTVGDLLSAMREVRAGRTVRPARETTTDDAGIGQGARASLLDRLSSREREIFDLIIWGLTNKQVAVRLGISVKTVETHRSHINGKLQVHSAAELVRLASMCGALSSGGPDPLLLTRAAAEPPRLVAKIG